MNYQLTINHLPTCPVYGIINMKGDLYAIPSFAPEAHLPLADKPAVALINGVHLSRRILSEVGFISAGRSLSRSDLKNNSLLIPLHAGF